MRDELSMALRSFWPYRSPRPIPTLHLWNHRGARRPRHGRQEQQQMRPVGHLHTNMTKWQRSTKDAERTLASLGYGKPSAAANGLAGKTEDGGCRDLKRQGCVNATVRSREPRAETELKASCRFGWNAGSLSFAYCGHPPTGGPQSAARRVPGVPGPALSLHSPFFCCLLGGLQERPDPFAPVRRGYCTQDSAIPQTMCFESPAPSAASQWALQSVQPVQWPAAATSV